MSSIQLEVGKRYVLRNGVVTGELSYCYDDSAYPFRSYDIDRCWTTTGREWYTVESPFDIVAEYQEPSAPQEPTTNQEESTMSSIQLEVGKTYRTARGDKVFCAAELAEGYFVILYKFVEDEGKFDLMGRYLQNGEAVFKDKDDNIISEWIDPPKTKKVLMYHALVSVAYTSGYFVTSTLFTSESDAKSNYRDGFIHLLTDRPVEVEVPV